MYQNWAFTGDEQRAGRAGQGREGWEREEGRGRVSMWRRTLHPGDGRRAPLSPVLPRPLASLPSIHSFCFVLLLVLLLFFLFFFPVFSSTFASYQYCYSNYHYCQSIILLYNYFYYYYYYCLSGIGGFTILSTSHFPLRTFFLHIASYLYIFFSPPSLLISASWTLQVSYLW